MAKIIYENTKIVLSDMRFYGRHGVLPHEHTVGNTFVVNLEAEYPAQPAMDTDNIDAAVNYADVARAVAAAMQKPSALLEHVAGRIVSDVMAACPKITAVTVTVTKTRPPIPGFTGSASFTATGRRNG